MTTPTRSTHTPGPWTVTPDAKSPHPDDLPRVWGTDPNTRGGFCVASCNRMEDARLIAAAPDLLALVQEVNKSARRFRGMEGVRIVDDDMMEQIYALLARLDGAQ